MIKKIFIIAGEASGDLIGARLIKSLKEITKQPLEFHGIGGQRMIKEGIKSLFPMSEISLLGFIEIIPQIFKVQKLIRLTVNSIKELQPDLVITIDSPGFCIRVAKAVKKLNIKIVHYVAPTVWAYKPGRAKKFARIYDHLLCILPFEPPYFINEGLKSSFVGHPIVEDFHLGDGKLFRSKYGIDEANLILCLMPGSRLSEIRRLLPIFLATADILSRHFTNLHLLIPTLPHLKDEVILHLQNCDIPHTIIANLEEKADLYSAVNIALVKSGTNSFELALNNIPMVVAYKVNPISAFLLRRMLKISKFNLINLIQDKDIIPELMQEKCNAKELSNALIELMQNVAAKEYQIKESKLAMEKIGLASSTKPSDKAAKIILRILNNEL